MIDRLDGSAGRDCVFIAARMNCRRCRVALGSRRDRRTQGVMTDRAGARAGRAAKSVHRVLRGEMSRVANNTAADVAKGRRGRRWTRRHCQREGREGRVAPRDARASRSSRERRNRCARRTLAAKCAQPMAGTMRALVRTCCWASRRVQRTRAAGRGLSRTGTGQAAGSHVGFSHPVQYQMPEGIKAETPSQTEIIVRGVDKQLVGQVAAEIRGFRTPEPYKGKGVRYAGEQISVKEGEEEVGEEAMNDKKEARMRRAAQTRVRCASSARRA